MTKSSYSENFVWLTSKITAIAGKQLIALAPDPNMAAWCSDNGKEFFCWLEENEDGLLVKFNPASENDWSKAYQIIGYCAYHGHQWEAP